MLEDTTFKLKYFYTLAHKADSKISRYWSAGTLRHIQEFLWKKKMLVMLQVFLFYTCIEYT